MLLGRESFSEIVIGNTALARAMLETGTRVVTSYPGSPTPEIADAILGIPEDQRPLYFEFSTNEKVATEVAFGASVNGHLSCVFFKSVGLNVAADSFVQLAHMELLGGLVIILGDDPGANSSQNEQDNRHYARLAHIPMWEPASASEAYLMYKEAARLSVQLRKPVILRMTTHVCHAKERVQFDAWEPVALNPTPRFDPANGPYIPIASAVFPLKARARARLGDFAAHAEGCSFNRLLDHNNSHRGVITAGLPFLSLLDCLEDVGAKPDVLRLGMVFPMAAEKIAAFLAAHDEVLVLEELDDFLEQAIKALAYDRGLHTKIVGKVAPEDWLGEFTPGKVRTILGRLWPDLGLAVAARDLPLPSPRPPQLCPGCGHRAAFWAIKQALADTDITVADIGCHTLGFQAPYRMGQALLSMGHCTGTAAGLSLFNQTRKVVAFIGDSTFFHAGLPGIINAIFNHHNFTLIVLENGTTAMTGHQDHPGSGHNVTGPSHAMSLDRILEALGPTSLRRTDAYAGVKLRQMVTEAVAEPGFKVIIASHPCMLKATREARRAGTFKDRMVTVNQTTCTLAHDCVSTFACPTFQMDAEGRVTTHPDLCIGDGSCLQSCPARAVTPPAPRGNGKES
jgi:indolepyruvate ferredoxin oxidoreductase alpha subunit